MCRGWVAWGSSSIRVGEGVVEAFLHYQAHVLLGTADKDHMQGPTPPLVHSQLVGAELNSHPLEE